jgi:hypothetical protein
MKIRWSLLLRTDMAEKGLFANEDSDDDDNDDDDDDD